MKKILVISAVAFFLIGYSLQARETTQQLPSDLNTTEQRSLTKTWEDICRESKDAVVQVISYVNEYNFLEPYKAPSQNAGSGTGFFISPDGELLTNFHVVRDAVVSYIQIPSLGQQRFELEFLGAAPERDIARLRLKPEALKEVKSALGLTELNHLKFGNSDELCEGQNIMTMGYPLGQQNVKVSIGDFAGRESMSIGECIQTTAAINGGNSGGPFFNNKGEVVGVCTIKMVGQQVDNVGYLIPMNTVNVVMDEMKDGNLVKNPFWGIHVIPTTKYTLEHLGNPTTGGIYVTKVDKGSLIDTAGIKKGDVVIHIDGYKLDHFGFLDASWRAGKASALDYLSRLKFGERTTLVVYREGQRLEKEIEIKDVQPHKINVHYPWFIESLEFEIIGGFVVVELTINHIDIYKEVAQYYNDENYFDDVLIKKYKQNKKRFEPRLIITSIFPSSQAHETRCFRDGDKIIKKVNDQRVQTIEDFRTAVLAAKGKEYLTIEAEGGSFAALPLKKVIEEEAMLAQRYFYYPSDLIEQLAS